VLADGGTDFVVPVGTDQHQVAHILLEHQILEQIERCRIEPLQIVEEEGERVFRPCEYGDESSEDQPESGVARPVTEEQGLVAALL